MARRLHDAAVVGDLRQSPKPAEKLDALYPPHTFEIRCEKGEEEPAAYLLALLKTAKNVARSVLFLVDTTPTPKCLSIFIPHQDSEARKWYATEAIHRSVDVRAAARR